MASVWERMRSSDMASASKRCISAVKMSEVAPRRHIGLQQLEAIAASARAFLGPNKRLKFIQDEDNGPAVLVKSCPRLLEHMELDDSVTQLLQETVRAHHKRFGSGTATLVFLSGVWSRAALECLNRGMTVTDIKSAMSRALDECLDVCRNSLHVEKFILSQTTNIKLPQTLGITLKHSRHFSLHDAPPENSDITPLARAVSHGCEAAMRLVLKACELQYKNNVPNGFLDIQTLVTCCIPGPSQEHSGVSHGYVTMLSVQQAVVVERFQGQGLNIALVDGDLSEEHRHVGFSRPASVVHITERLSGVSLEERWIENALTTLREFSVDVVLVSGIVDRKLKDQCTDVLVLEGVRRSVLKAFSSCTGAVPLSYISELEERRVGRGVSVRREIWGTIEALNIRTGNTTLVTAVITSSVPAKLQILEDEFWSCAHRLHQALTDRKLLPGGGSTELMCMRKLHQLRCSEEERAVLELMAEAWMDFISTLMMNAGTVESKTEAWTAVAHQVRLQKDGVDLLWDTDGAGVYDNVTVKCEAWRRALDLVLLVLQSDTEIITGVSEGEDVYNQLVFL